MRCYLTFKLCLFAASLLFDSIDLWATTLLTFYAAASDFFLFHFIPFHSLTQSSNEIIEMFPLATCNPLKRCELCSSKSRIELTLLFQSCSTYSESDQSCWKIDSKMTIAIVFTKKWDPWYFRENFVPHKNLCQCPQRHFFVFGFKIHSSSCHRTITHLPVMQMTRDEDQLYLKTFAKCSLRVPS